jgi:hypothetical protein
VWTVAAGGDHRTEEGTKARSSLGETAEDEWPPHSEILMAGKKYGSARFEVSSAVAMKDDVFWEIQSQLIPHRRHISLSYKVQPVNAM